MCSATCTPVPFNQNNEMNRSGRGTVPDGVYDISQLYHHTQRIPQRGQTLHYRGEENTDRQLTLGFVMQRHYNAGNLCYSTLLHHSRSYSGTTAFVTLKKISGTKIAKNPIFTSKAMSPNSNDLELTRSQIAAIFVASTVVVAWTNDANQCVGSTFNVK